MKTLMTISAAILALTIASAPVHADKGGTPNENASDNAEGSANDNGNKGGNGKGKGVGHGDGDDNHGGKHDKWN